MHEIHVYTDGSAVRNGRRDAKAAYAVFFPEHVESSMAALVPQTDLQTNNRAEMMAVLRALEIVMDHIDPRSERAVVVHTDSMLLVNSFTKWLPGWKARGWKKADGTEVMHPDLLMSVEAILAARKSAGKPVSFVHVRAHARDPPQHSEQYYNNIADKMARDAIIPQMRQ